MKATNLIVTVCGVMLKIFVTILVVYAIYRGATICYDYGYRIFAEEPMSAGEGRTVTVTITSDMEPKEMGTLLMSKGLIRDDKLFVWQYYLSAFREDIKSGTYELSTAMTVEEMLEVMATEITEETEE